MSVLERRPREDKNFVFYNGKWNESWPETVLDVFSLRIEARPGHSLLKNKSDEKNKKIFTSQLCWTSHNALSPA